MLPHWVIYATIYPLYIYHCSSVLLLLGLALVQIVRAPVSITKFMLRKRNQDAPLPAPPAGAYSHDPRRRVFLRQSVAASAGIIFAGSAYATYRCDDYEIDEITIPVAGLPEAFQGFTIALISDIHSSVFMLKEQMMEYARVVNSFGADLIAVPGDFVNSMLEEVYPFAEAFSSLRAPYGVFGVLGNHDYYTRKVDAVAAEVEQCGIKLLRNTHTVLERNGQKIALVGIDDSSSFRVSIPAYQRAARGIADGIPKVLLCHRPIFFDKAADRGVQVMLAGHTHGGQVVLARIGDRTISPLGITSRYIAGLYERDGSRLYVSRGVGTVGVPYRLNCPPEVTKITLTKA
jgi:predicted MPP superfamily phosphohydrolase